MEQSGGVVCLLNMKEIVETILKDRFGYDAFRSGQRSVIEDILQGGARFIVMPTGGGKSLTYLLPAFIFSLPTLVITPLRSLMHDQKRRCDSIGLGVVLFSNSDVKKLRDSKLILATPESLFTETGLAKLSLLEVSHLVIDEAHCVNSWGASFRPFYGLLERIVGVLAPFSVSVISASADYELRKSVLDRLKLSGGKEFLGGFDRRNIAYHVVKVKYPEVMLASLLFALTGKVLVYCTSRAEVERIAIFLQRIAIAALPYHAGMSGEERRNAEALLRENKIRVLVATSAFGMGVDIPDIRSVLHLGLPVNIDSYYQESGRAGRDGEPALALVILSSNQHGIVSPPSSAHILLGQERSLPRVVMAENLFLERLAIFAAGRIEVYSLLAFLLFHGVYVREEGESGILVRPLGNVAYLLRQAIRKALRKQSQEKKHMRVYLYGKRCRRFLLLKKYTTLQTVCSGCDICSSPYQPLIEKAVTWQKRIESIQRRLLRCNWRERMEIIRSSRIGEVEKALLNWCLINY